MVLFFFIGILDKDEKEKMGNLAFFLQKNSLEKTSCRLHRVMFTFL